MYKLQQTYQASFRKKGSKFIAHLFPVPSVSAFDKQLAGIVSDYPDATHHCYGWRINPHQIEEFAQDDGEPRGTAGLPILNKLKSYKVVNCGCIVVRYYGGTKLGKSGLIQAYGEAALHCLQQASFSKLIPTQNFCIIYGYSQQNEIDRLKNSFDLKELTAEYLENICLEVACRTEQSQAFRDALQQLEHHGIRAEKLGNSFVTMP